MSTFLLVVFFAGAEKPIFIEHAGRPACERALYNMRTTDTQEHIANAFCIDKKRGYIYNK